MPAHLCNPLEQMSEKEHVRPYHAKDAAPGKEAADVVAEVLKHAQAREEAAKKKEAPKGPPRWMLPLSVNLGVLALYFLIAQPDFLVVNPIEDRRPVEARVEMTRRAMYFEGISRIEQFRLQNGRLPATLEEANAGALASQGVDYSIRGDSAYILITTVDSETILFDSSSQSAQDFVGDLNTVVPR